MSKDSSSGDGVTNIPINKVGTTFANSGNLVCEGKFKITDKGRRECYLTYLVSSKY